MALPTWPASLPEYFEARSLNVVAKPQKIVTRPEVGRVRSRRRTTVNLSDVTGNLLLTGDQRDTLLQFYKVTLRGGTRRFNWHHPWDPGISVTMEFVGPAAPSITAQGSLVFVASLQLEMEE